MNVPPYATKDSLKKGFLCIGDIDKVILKNSLSNLEVTKKNGFMIAYIVFKVPSSINKALALTSIEPLSSDSHPIHTGLKKWTSEYNSNIFDNEKLNNQVNHFMASYDNKIKLQKQQEKEKDEEGWTVVGKKSRGGKMARKESVKNKLLEKSSQDEKRKQLTDFYTFQKREAKMNHLAEMRRKYEEDKKKVTAMKQARKFKPF